MENARCPICNKEIDIKREFKDNLSLAEYRISGLCQRCQDEVFDNNDYLEGADDEQWRTGQDY